MAMGSVLSAELLPSLSLLLLDGVVVDGFHGSPWCSPPMSFVPLSCPWSTDLEYPDEDADVPDWGAIGGR
jgi:hypothetical protein